MSQKGPFLLENKTRDAGKARIELYQEGKEYLANDRFAKELQEWKRKESEYKYELLKGLILSNDLEKVNQWRREEEMPYVKGDTFFSEFKLHNDSALVLSESNDSYIIANRESYDKSQYPDDPGKAGQGFGHALVIPRKRVYNVVDPDATKDRCKLLQEMKQHFIGFWKTAIGQKKLVEATWEGVCARNNTLKRANRALDEKDLEEQERRFNDFAGKYKALNADRDFHYVVHPHPYHSVGHLHLHVFPSNSELRSRSPRSHDWKSIPLDVITRLEDEEEIERKKKAPRPSTPRKDWELLHPGTGPPTSGASAGSNIHHIRPGAATRR